MATLTEFKTKNLHCFYANGRRHGEYKVWHDNGQLLVHCFYVDGKRHGEYMHWHEHGQLLVHRHYVNDRRHGEYKRWYENGTLHGHCVYIADKKLDIDITNITHKDKFILHLKYGDFHWLP